MPDGRGQVDPDDGIAAQLPYGPVTWAGEGGMAVVYRGYCAEREEAVAIKVLRSALLDRPDVVAAFQAEHDLGTLIDHPGVVAVHERGEIDGVPYLVMPWCDGQTLADRVAFEPMAMRRVIAIGAQVASALAAVHEAGVVHCDVKPENIMLMKDSGQARLLDFGVARRADAGPVASDLVSGTPSYMSPEQWEGVAGPASDVYSLGCVLYELLTGAPPFSGSLPQVMRGHREDAPPPVLELRADAPSGLANLIMSMLEKDADVRPSMDEVAHRLRAWAASPATLRRTWHAPEAPLVAAIAVAAEC